MSSGVEMEGNMDFLANRKEEQCRKRLDEMKAPCATCKNCHGGDSLHKGRLLASVFCGSKGSDAGWRAIPRGACPNYERQEQKKEGKSPNKIAA